LDSGGPGKADRGPPEEVVAATRAKKAQEDTSQSPPPKARSTEMAPATAAADSAVADFQSPAI